MKKEINLEHMTPKLLELQIQEQLLRLLDDVPFLRDVNVYSSQSNTGHDIEATVIIESGRRVMLFCEVKSSGEPKHVRSAANRWIQTGEHYNGINQEDYYVIIAAPYISPQSSRICEENNLGYLDLSGNCLIKYKGIYIRVEGKPNKYKNTRKSKSIYERNSIKSSVILRELLSNPKRQWKTKELAEATSSSLGQISNVKKFLDEREYLFGGEQGFYVNRPGEIIEEWAKVYHEKSNTVVECYSSESIPQFEKSLEVMRGKKGIDYALTGFSGAVRYSPTVRYNKSHVYISYQDVYEAVDFLKLKEVDTGSNVSIIIPYDPCIMIDSREIQGSIVASPVQVCLELLGLKGRGEEAALAILRSGVFK